MCRIIQLPESYLVALQLPVYAIILTRTAIVHS